MGGGDWMGGEGWGLDGRRGVGGQRRGEKEVIIMA